MKYAAHFAALSIAAGTGFLGMAAQPALATKVSLEGLDAHETHASASLLGQFRTNTSSWLWLRTDLYLHNGVEMRPLTEAEKKAGKMGVGNGEAGKDALHDDNSIVTTVPSAEHDFRGIFGDIERAGNAYADMKGHTHNDPNRALPLFRLMTWIDPTFIPGWTVGATVMGRNGPAGVDQGIALLREGLQHNPASVSLLGELGRFYAAKKHDFKRALVVLHKAVDASIALENLSETEVEGYREAFRWTCLAHREEGQYAEMQAAARRGLQLFPDDPVLQRSLNAPASSPKVAPDDGDAEHHDH